MPHDDPPTSNLLQWPKIQSSPNERVTAHVCHHKTNPVFVDTMRERQRVPLGTAYEVEYECGNAVKTVSCLHRDFKLVPVSQQEQAEATRKTAEQLVLNVYFRNTYRLRRIDLVAIEFEFG